MTKLTERARLERRIADLKEREANISDRIARTKLGQDLADVQLLIERAVARMSALEPTTSTPAAGPIPSEPPVNPAASPAAAREMPGNPRTTDATMPDLPDALNVKNRTAAHG